MRSKLLLIITVSFLLSSIHAQTYEPLVAPYKMWVVYRANYYPPGTGRTLAYKIAEDSVSIDDEYWHRILKAEDSLYSQWSIYAYIREENRIVYLKDSYADILYDFHLGPGDTCFNADSEIMYLIEDTLTGYFAGRDRFAQVIKDRGDTLFTGSGSKRGGLLGPEYYQLTGADYTLVCYYENDSLLYHNPDFTRCYIDNTSSTEDLKENDEIKIYPDPVDEKLFIETKIPVRLILYDLNGKKVLSAELHRGTNIFQTGTLSPSVYICRILSGKETVSYKLLKVKR